MSGDIDVEENSGEGPKMRPLRRVSARPPLGDYLRQIWERRHFIRMQGWSQAMSQHQGTILGNVWLIIGPLMDGLVYFIIFGVLFDGARGGIDNFFGYLTIGVFLFTFTARCLRGSAKCIDANRGLMRAFNFPRASLPIAVVWRECIALLPVMYVLVILILVVPPRGVLSWLWLLLIPLLFLQTLFNTGISFISARIGARIPDWQQVIPYLSRFWMYFSCVMWTMQRFEQIPPMDKVAENNPTFIVLDIARDILLWGETPELMSWIKLTLWAVFTAVVGLLFFWQAEVKYARRAHE